MSVTLLWGSGFAQWLDVGVEFGGQTRDKNVLTSQVNSGVLGDFVG